MPLATFWVLKFSDFVKIWGHDGCLKDVTLKYRHFCHNLCLDAYISGLEWNFAKLPKGDSNSWAWRSCVQNFRSLAPREAEPRPFKEGNPQPIFTIFECSYLNDLISGLEWTFSKISRPKINSLTCSIH